MSSWQIETGSKKNITDLVVVQTLGTTQNTNGLVTIWNNVIRDNQSQWNNSTFTFTAKENGLYFVLAKLIFAATLTTGQRWLTLFKNGASFINLDFKEAYGNNTQTMLNGMATIRLNATDTINFQLAAAGNSTIDDPLLNQLSIVRLF